MPSANRKPMESIQIQIFGHTYSIKAMENPEYVRELAAFLDGKMREVQQGTGTADPHRVAILTALTISDELFRLRERCGTIEQSADQAVERMLALTGDEGAR